MSTTAATVLKKEYMFKDDNRGISKKSGKPYRMLVLHDPATLENESFFLNEDSHIDTDNIRLKDKVEASFHMEMMFGKTQLVINSLKKIG